MPGIYVVVTEWYCVLVNCKALRRAFLYLSIVLWGIAVRLCRGKPRLRLSLYRLDLILRWHSGRDSTWSA